MSLLLLISFLISIHAPAKGATINHYILSNLHHISIHAPAKGATRSGRSNRRFELYFNPRSREGSDMPGLKNCQSGHAISIHAPAKGATEIMDTVFVCTVISIHAPAKGATKVEITVLALKEQFQSTLPRRERQQYYTTNFIFFV